MNLNESEPIRTKFNKKKRTFWDSKNPKNSVNFLKSRKFRKLASYWLCLDSFANAINLQALLLKVSIKKLFLSTYISGNSDK